VLIFELYSSKVSSRLGAGASSCRRSSASSASSASVAKGVTKGASGSVSSIDSTKSGFFARAASSFGARFSSHSASFFSRSGSSGEMNGRWSGRPFAVVISCATALATSASGSACTMLSTAS